MIKRLHIRNYAIIEELEIDFPEGLTIITGETGAGKSILLGALGMIMGKRADSKSMYDASKKCSVEGVFEVEKYDLRSFFAEHDLDYFPECLIRRELSPSGRSRAFVNDTPVTLDVLRQLTGALIDLHEQFDNLDIHQVSFQLRMVDALAGNKKLLDGYQSAHRKYTADKRRLRQLLEQSERSAQEVDFLKFQLDEFDRAALVDGEQAELETEQSRLGNAGEIKQRLNAAFQHLTEGESPLVEQLKEVVRSVSEVKKYHPDLPALHQRMEGISLELEDVAGEFERLAAGTEFDPERIAEIQKRLDTIYRLQNKHRVNSEAELIDIQSNLETKLAAIGDLSGEIEALEKDIAEQEEKLRETAAKLSGKRKKAAPGFAKKVLGLLEQMAMPHTRFEINFQPLDELTPTGTDEISFLFAANPGSRLQHIRDVASGGEISRLTLVTKSLVASAIPLPTLIFDEIDTGISGDISLKMGGILRQLSDHHQVINITHSPQIAAQADAHFFGYKKMDAHSTVTKVKLLDEEERVRSIAVMLSQNPPSESALANARELILTK